jgi:hypothetical protein
MNAGRVALALIALSLASTAHAGKYVEVWNPPEARGHTGGPSAAAPARAHPQSLKQSPRQTLASPRLAKKVTEPAGTGAGVTGADAGASRAQQGGSSVASSKRSASRTIPRKIGPDGNVFRV